MRLVQALPVMLLAILQQLDLRQAQTTATEQTLNLVARLIKSMQASACDGEQLLIQCPDEYTIDVITGALEVLAPSAANTCPSSPVASNNSSPIGCDTEASRALSQSDKESLASLVRTGCHLRNSCLLDLRSAPTIRPATNHSLVSNTTQLDAATDVSKLGLMLANKCPKHRKLLEVSYRCRPVRFLKRALCQGESLKLECPPEKRLVIASASYGSLPSDTKMLERCDSQHSPRPPSTDSYRDCQSSNASVAVMDRCILMTRCRLDVGPSILGEPNCPEGQPKYLKVIYVCLFANMIRNESIFRSRSELPPTVPSVGPQFIMPPPVSSVSVLSMSLEDIGSSTHHLLNASSVPHLATRFTGRPSTTEMSLLDPYQGLVLLAHRYKIYVFALTGFSLSVVMLGFLVRTCRSRSAGLSTTSSKGSSSQHSANSSCSSKCASNCSTGGLLLNSRHNLHYPLTDSSRIGQNTFHSAQQKQHGSNNSESCFSLDDCNLASDSPALMSNLTPIASTADAYTHQQHLPPPNATATSRPKLWTIYGHEQIRPPGSQLPGTLRATRTFVSQRAPVCPHQPPAEFGMIQGGTLRQSANASWSPHEQYQQQSPMQFHIQQVAELQQLNSASQGQHCTFHQSQLQQQQQQPQPQPQHHHQQQQPQILLPPPDALQFGQQHVAGVCSPAPSQQQSSQHSGGAQASQHFVLSNKLSLNTQDASSGQFLP